MLFGLFKDGRKNPGIDTGHGLIETSEGYEAIAKTFGDAARRGYSIDPSDPNVQRIAEWKGITPEEYAANAKYY